MDNVDHSIFPGQKESFRPQVRHMWCYLILSGMTTYVDTLLWTAQTMTSDNRVPQLHSDPLESILIPLLTSCSVNFKGELI